MKRQRKERQLPSKAERLKVRLAFARKRARETAALEAARSAWSAKVESKKRRSFISTTVDVGSVDVSLDIEDVIDDLRAQGYVVIEDGGNSGGGAADPRPPAVRAYEAYGARDLRRLDAALRDWFDLTLGRIVGEPPWPA